MFSARFPRSAFSKRAFQAIILSSSLSLAASPSLAKGGNPKSAEKPSPRPAARLISSYSTPDTQPRERTRLVARTSSPSESYTPYSAPSGVSATGDERRAFDLINAERQRRGLSPLILDGALTRLARYQSQNMAREGVLSHVTGNGLDLRGRAQALGLHGWNTLGENIAYNQGYSDPTAFAVERWMVSPMHRENILNGEFTHAGVGIARAADGRIFFTQVFMGR